MSLPRAAILTIGNELLDGRVVNSNAAFLAYRLTDIGFLVLSIGVNGTSRVTRTSRQPFYCRSWKGCLPQQP